MNFLSSLQEKTQNKKHILFFSLIIWIYNFCSLYYYIDIQNTIISTIWVFYIIPAYKLAFLFLKNYLIYIKNKTPELNNSFHFSFVPIIRIADFILPIIFSPALGLVYYFIIKTKKKNKY